MFDPKLYREACRELTAPEDKIEEVIAMTEHTNKKTRRTLRTTLICAVAAAMMVVGVSAANPEGVEELWRSFQSVIQVDQYRTDVTTEEGKMAIAISAPKARLENQDGRAILVIEDKEPIDITGALAQAQHYVYEDIAEGSKVIVTVEGTIDQWSITVAVGTLEEDGSYRWFGSVEFTSEDGDAADSGIFIDNHNSVLTVEEGDYVSYTYAEATG